MNDKYAVCIGDRVICVAETRQQAEALSSIVNEAIAARAEPGLRHKGGRWQMLIGDRVAANGDSREVMLGLMQIVLTAVRETRHD